jgi:hypothetical protein
MKKSHEKGKIAIKFKKNGQELDADISAQASEKEGKSAGDLFRNKLSEIVGVGESELAVHIFNSAAKAIHPFFDSAENWNVILQSLHDFEPQDAVEARLIAQSAVLYAYAMKSMERAGDAGMLMQIEAMTNLGIKLMRVHNETIESLSRYRRGGEQKVTVTHAVVAGQAIVNNFNGVGGSSHSRGDTPCSESAERKQGPTAISHVGGRQWPMGAADCMEEKAQVRRRNQVKSASKLPI